MIDDYIAEFKARCAAGAPRPSEVFARAQTHLASAELETHLDEYSCIAVHRAVVDLGGHPYGTLAWRTLYLDLLTPRGVTGGDRPEFPGLSGNCMFVGVPTEDSQGVRFMCLVLAELVARDLDL